jgi:hypothetical protein
VKSLNELKQSLHPKKFRKKGQVFIEYIIVFPIMVFSFIFFCGLSLYGYDIITTNILSEKIGDTVIQETRGNPKTLKEIDPEEKLIMKKIIAGQILDSYVSPFTKLRYDENFQKVDEQTILDSIVMEDPALCKAKMEQKQRVICIESISLTDNETIKEEIKVEIYAPFNSFHFVDQFIDGMNSNNTTIRELGRTNNFW